MTDSARDNPESPQKVNPEVFARLLECLSSNQDEAVRQYTSLHKKLIGFFNLRGISDPVSAADETIDRAALKISAGAIVPDVGRYCRGIARNIVKERLRRAEREHAAFQSFVEEIQNASDNQVERIYYILKPCFESLAADDQKLLLDYCQVMQGRARAEHRRRLAEAMMTTVLALRMRVTRLRGGLADCVRRRSEVA